MAQDVPDWTQSVNVQNADIPVSGPVTIEAGQSGIGVFTGSLEVPQQVNSSYRTAAGTATYTATVPLFTLTTSVGVVAYPPASSSCPAGTTVAVSIVGGTSGFVYVDAAELDPGEGNQVQAALSGLLEATAVVKVTYSSAPTASAYDCFFIGTFGPPGPLVTSSLPAPPTSGWVNAQPAPGGPGYATVLAVGSFAQGGQVLPPLTAGRYYITKVQACAAQADYAILGSNALGFAVGVTPSLTPTDFAMPVNVGGAALVLTGATKSQAVTLVVYGFVGV
jgi:hypothetical protein